MASCNTDKNDNHLNTKKEWWKVIVMITLIINRRYDYDAVFFFFFFFSRFSSFRHFDTSSVSYLFILFLSHFFFFHLPFFYFWRKKFAISYRSKGQVLKLKVFSTFTKCMTAFLVNAEGSRTNIYFIGEVVVLYIGWERKTNRQLCPFMPGWWTIISKCHRIYKYHYILFPL